VVAEKLSPLSFERDRLEPYLEAAVHDLNHRPRASLNGQNACQTFFGKKDTFKYSKRERRAIYDWIIPYRENILMEKCHPIYPAETLIIRWPAQVSIG